MALVVRGRPLQWQQQGWMSGQPQGHKWAKTPEKGSMALGSTYCVYICSCCLAGRFAMQPMQNACPRSDFEVQRCLRCRRTSCQAWPARCPCAASCMLTAVHHVLVWVLCTGA